jgi:hypothetical protein
MRDDCDANGEFATSDKLNTVLTMLLNVSDVAVDLPTGTDENEVLRHYVKTWKEKYGEEPAIAWKGKDRTTARTLLTGPPRRSVDGLKLLIDEYLADDSDRFITGSMHALGLLPHRINVLIANRKARINDDFKISWVTEETTK